MSAEDDLRALFDDANKILQGNGYQGCPQGCRETHGEWVHPKSWRELQQIYDTDELAVALNRGMFVSGYNPTSQVVTVVSVPRNVTQLERYGFIGISQSETVEDMIRHLRSAHSTMLGWSQSVRGAALRKVLVRQTKVEPLSDAEMDELLRLLTN